MTLLRFRVDAGEAREAQRWAEALGIDRSELLREALRRHLASLASEPGPALEGIAAWGPAEDWSDWAG